MKRFLLLFVMVSLFSCAPVVSRELRERAERDLSFSALLRDPDRYEGRIVILGGIIASSLNTDEGTYIEVVQQPLDYRGIPEDTDVTEGRFLILYEGYLDKVIYSEGKKVTVAGVVIGKRVRLLEEMEYPYPLIKSREIHLFTPRYGTPVRFGIGIFKTF